MNGANLNHRCKESRYNTALHEAVIGGHREIVQYLLTNEANQLLKDETGCIPLHHACMLGDIIIARLLIRGKGGKKAMLAQNNQDLMPIDVCANNFVKSGIEGTKLIQNYSPWF